MFNQVLHGDGHKNKKSDRHYWWLSLFNFSLGDFRLAYGGQ